MSDAMMHRLMAMLEKLTEELPGRFEGIEGRLERIETRIESNDKRLDAHSGVLEKVEGLSAEVEKTRSESVYIGEVNGRWVVKLSFKTLPKLMWKLLLLALLGLGLGVLGLFGHQVPREYVMQWLGG